jgi:outer membrane protein assembly factor BamB
VLTATDLKSGRTLWTHAEPSPIDFRMVAISNGKVLFYSENSRLAPVERRVLMFGKLMSTWPVFSVLADEGRVYAVAGQWRMSGSKAFAMDAATGEILWSRAFEPYVTQFTEYPLEHYSFGGNLTLIKGKLWAAASDGTVIATLRDGRIVAVR